MIHATMRVPLHKLKQLQEVLRACKGRFDYNPEIDRQEAFVSISFDDPQNGTEFSRRWQRLTRDVQENYRKYSWWKRFCKALRSRRRRHGY